MKHGMSGKMGKTNAAPTRAALGENKKLPNSSYAVNHAVHHVCGNDMGPLERVSREDLPKQGRGMMPRNK